MQRMVALASGKGGVGKSVLAANLGLALAQAGQTVILVDLDLGAANLHTCLGIKNRHPGLGSLIWKQERKLSALLVETGYERLWLIPGDNLLPGTANLDWNAKQRILKDLRSLPADWIILDLGAGSSHNVVDFYLAAAQGVLVINPEITSVLNAYSFLKTSAYRALQRSFPEGSEERARLLAFAGSATEGSGASFVEFARALAVDYPATGPGALEALGRLSPFVVVNRGKSRADADLGARLRDISRRNLGLDVAFSGFLLEDPLVAQSVARRTPLLLLEPEAPFAHGVRDLAGRLYRAPDKGGFPTREGEETAGDLDALAAEALGEAEPGGDEALPGASYRG